MAKGAITFQDRKREVVNRTKRLKEQQERNRQLLSEIRDNLRERRTMDIEINRLLRSIKMDKRLM